MAQTFREAAWNGCPTGWTVILDAQGVGVKPGPAAKPGREKFSRRGGGCCIHAGDARQEIP
jgi:hypothetical protein